MDQHYHPIVYQRLRELFAAGDWNALKAYLEKLSNAHFRTAGYLLGERLLPTAEPDVFWSVAEELILWQPKAFTITMGKSALRRLQQGTLSIDDAGLQHLASSLTGEKHLIDRQKLLRLWLTAVRQPQEMEQLFHRFGVTDNRRKVDFLLHTDGLASAFLLLRALRYEDHDPAYLTNVSRQVMKRADNLSFNLASLLRTFFDLQEVKGTFSLALQPYELSRLDSDFDVFCRVMTKV
ncbi:MAG: hypothetical protein K6C30_02200 [Bacteroidaceae bacterium]|nr:hypothetical protein [Bacteroidaceae bacterium]